MKQNNGVEWVTPARFGKADAIGWGVVAICVALLFLLGCEGGGHHQILPTVMEQTGDLVAAAPPAPELAAGDAFVVCHDADGTGPDKLFQVAKTLTPNTRFCYVSGDCYYDCRQGLPGQ